jgi:hypothetical protein
VKFILFVEGPTEAKALPAFLKRWLDPRLNQPVGVQAVHFDGAGELIAEIPSRVERLLNAPAQDVIAVVALLDLQGLPLSYPADVTSMAEKVSWAKQELESKANNIRFRQFLVVHELEAWLLSDVTIFPHDLQGAFPAKIKQPEKVNFNEPPSDLIRKLYQSKMRKPYKKSTEGEKLFTKLNPDTAYAKCPHLKALLDEMLALAKSAGQ